MDIAKCSLNQQTYNAVTFAELPPDELSNKRQNLVCTECQADAFFRKASRSGQAACFGARPHTDGCVFASPETQTNEADGGDENIINNPGRVIEIDLNFGAARQNAVIDPNEGNGAQGRGGRHIGRGVRPNINMQRRLSTLLRNLMNSDEFRNSTQQIKLEGRDATSVRDFFLKFSDTPKDHDGKIHGYWGMLTDARLDRSRTLWLNSGGPSSVSCALSLEDINELYARYNISDEEEFVGAYILVIGARKTSKNGKKYIKLANANHLVARFNKF